MGAGGNEQEGYLLPSERQNGQWRI